MNIESVAKNESLRLYYKSHNLESNQNIVFNIWDETGAQLYANIPSDGEIAGRGIYYVDIITPIETHIFW